MKTRVSDVMTAGVITARPATPFHELAEMLSLFRISAVPVVDSAERVVGVVSEADLMLKEIDALDAGERPSLAGVERNKAAGRIAADLMTAPPITIPGQATISEAARMMHDRGVKRLPVVDGGGRLVGIVTRGDLLVVFMRPDAVIRTEILEEVVIRSLWMDPAGIRVEVEGGLVKLGGEVDRHSDIAILERLIKGVEGVVGVNNELRFRYDDVPFALPDWRAIL